MLLSEGKSIEIKDILEELGIEFHKWLEFEAQHFSKDPQPQLADRTANIHSKAPVKE